MKTITLPGAIDLHLHLREPSTNPAETIASGTKAALLGGVTMVCDMPNNPGSPTWTMERLNDKQKRIKRSAYIPVGTYAGSQPESNNLDELAEMSQHCVGLKLYGALTTGNENDYQASDFEAIVKTWHQAAPNKPIMIHAGQHNADEFIDLIARKYKHHMHLCHVNSPVDVEMIKRAKAKKLKVSCGVCPHHLFKTTHNEVTEGWFARMKPPLVRQSESEQLLAQLAKGDIDVIETDHAPHRAQAKWTAEAGEGTCFGVPGVEFVIPLMLYQVDQGRLSLERLIDATSTRPAKIMGLKILPQTKVTWELSKYRIGDEKIQLSGSGWTPYMGMIAGGRLKKVVANGKTLVENGKIVAKEPRVVSQRGEKLLKTTDWLELS